MPSSPAALQTVRQWQSETDEIREAQEPIKSRAAVLMLAGLLITLLAITPFVNLDRTVLSQGGKIVSAEGVKIYQALDPSLVKSIDVSEGQSVKAGDLLATLDPTFASADVQQLRQQVAGLRAQIIRAQAELAGQSPEFPVNAAEEDQSYSRLQKALFDQRVGESTAQLHSFDEKIATTQATLAKLEADQVRYKEREGISKQVESMRDTLYKSGSSSLLNLLQANDARLEMQRTQEFGQNSLIEAQHQLSSLIADREAYIQNRRSTLSQELVTARNAYDTAVAQLTKAARHQDLVRLTAAEDSVVLNIPKLSVGSVLKEGDAVMTLVPKRAVMQAEVRLSSRDIGFVRPGDACTLKVDAFNFVEHGTAKGHITWISEGAFTADDDGKPVDPFYKARIEITDLQFIDVPGNFRLIPGMTASADINVGQRSVFKYIVGGFFRGFGEAMREP